MNHDFIVGMITACRAQMRALDQTLGILEAEFQKQRAAQTDPNPRCPLCGSLNVVEYSVHGETPKYTCAEPECSFRGPIKGNDIHNRS